MSKSSTPLEPHLKDDDECETPHEDMPVICRVFVLLQRKSNTGRVAVVMVPGVITNPK